MTNVDGTGYDFVSEDDETEDDAQDDAKIDALKEFFAQPWPGMSFSEIRRIAAPRPASEPATATSKSCATPRTRSSCSATWTPR